MNCLDVLRQLILNLNLEKCIFTLIEHEVGVNWRVRYRTIEQKVQHIDEALIQHSPLNSWQITGYSILSENFEPELLINPSAKNRVISITSRVICKKKQWHLALMNLHPEDGLTYDEMKMIVKKVTQGMQGYILKSGRYYHFYGITLLSEQEWLRFLSNFLMPTIIVSPRYIGHSLYRGYTCLRLTVDSEYKPMLPTVCDQITGQVKSPALHV